MSKVISTAGLTPFKVTIARTVPSMVRFVRAVDRTGAKVASTGKGKVKDRELRFLVWLSPMYVALFESYCEPLSFQFVSAEAVSVTGAVKDW